MPHLNVEIKARTESPSRLREILLNNSAKYIDTDLQTDTYFHTVRGRLKLRASRTENNLIYYERADATPGPRKSEVNMIAVPDPAALRGILVAALGLRVEVVKTREILKIENVRFHLDVVRGLGNFIEIEAVDYDGTLGPAILHQQCQRYMDLLEIRPADLIGESYSDMLLNA